MKAYVLEDVNKFDIKDVCEPQLGEKDVLLKVKSAGICGSDIPRIYKTGTYHYPLIPGHEFAGEVIQCGLHATKWLRKRVGVFPLIPCMECEQCKKKKYEMCADYNYLGSRTNGGFTEYVKVPEWNLIELPEDVTFEKAAMLEPMAVAVHAIKKAELDKMNSIIAVMGLGTIGLSIIMFLLSEGYTNIIAVGNKEIQKNTAISLGLTEEQYIDSNKHSLKENSVDVFFECVGTKEVLCSGLNSIKPDGKLICVGNPLSDMEIPQKVYWKILRKQIKIIGTWNSSFVHDKSDDWNYVIERLSQKSIEPEKLISHKFGFEDLIKGFNLMKDKSEDYIKIIGVF